MMLIDEIQIAKLLEKKAPKYQGSFTVERIGEGQANLTFLVQGNGWELVLRRPPRGELPQGAFDVTREFRVMQALHDHESPVPVPTPIALSEDPLFYLMNRLYGHTIRSELPSELSPIEERSRISYQLVETLASLHSIDYDEIGLGDFGKPVGYLERQLKRMLQQWKSAKFRDIPEIDEVGEWLEANAPSESRHSIVHGDYKLDNVMFGLGSPARLIAVMDWEMSTLGDPLADVGWMLYFWRDPGDEDLGMVASTVTQFEGFPRRRELLSRYAASSGADVSRILWYVALAGWKIAIIMEGSYGRYLAGIADHPTFGALDQAVPAFARRAALAKSGEFGI